MGAKPTYRSTARFVLESVEGLIVATVVLGTWFVSKRWLADWGSTPAERSNKWPGDSLAPAGVEFYTRAIDVAVPAAVVWQWVVQFGLDRAGFYSYELFERLVGIPVRNVEAILPEYQDLAVGSQIKLHPTAPGVPVGLIEHGSHVCFGEAGEVGPNTPDPRRSWSIYLRSESPGRCRLVLRTRLEGLRSPTRAKRVALALDAPIDFVMEQRMLRTIRRLAESST